MTVGVVDTGIDDLHEDLKANFSAEQSVNCAGGFADTTEGAWRPTGIFDYHGTHVAGTVAAPRNGVGVAGVAPGVRVASLKVSQPRTQKIYAEAVVCAFVFAADHGVEITNNSYFTDPWYFNCLADPDQRAIVDASSPNDDGNPVRRTVDPSECPDVPAQLPGVVTVSATGVKDLKSEYSNYGHEVIDVAAPGGDELYQVPDTPSKDGKVLSTMPGNGYQAWQGTSNRR